MKTRRRRWFRDETVAPWITLAVIVGLWWLGSRVVGPTPSSAPERVQPAPADQLSDATPTRGEPPPVSRSDSGVGTEAAPRLDETTPLDPAPAVVPGKLVVPVVGIDPGSLRSMFNEDRGGGSRRHEALDILAPRGTPVVAAIEGRIVKLFTSKAGGLTIYQFDPEERYCYYYAHLDSYAPNLNEGQMVRRGEVIGTVGTTGNAPPETPHLHFAVFKLGADKRWWEGEPVDPYELLR